MHIKILRVTTRTKTRHNFKITEEKSQSNKKKKKERKIQAWSMENTK